MEFKTAAVVEQLVWEMKLADYPRAENRSRINSIANGDPPYSVQEQEQNNIETNVNFLEMTNALHDARRQYSTAFSASDKLFTVGLDSGPRWKRREWAATITSELNKIIRASRAWLDQQDSTFASCVLHGIGPAVWRDKESWCPKPRGIEDILIPSNTLVSFDNLPFFAVYEQYTASELWRKVHGPYVDPGWNVGMADELINWVDQKAGLLFNNNWAEVWSPEKLQERMKQDSGLYASDAVATIDTYSFYYWSDEEKNSGWRRKVVLDAWGQPGVGGWSANSKPDRQYDAIGEGEFLYDSGKRKAGKYADKMDEIIHCQFADGSAVAPFRYHSVRSLGFLNYAVSHLQNRLRCRFNDAMFEATLQYFRVNDPADAERLTKVDLIDKGIIPPGLTFIPAGERWQVPAELMGNGMEMNAKLMASNSRSYTQDFDFNAEASKETATRTMAKVNASSALTGSMLNKAYNLERFKYMEICRRFCMKDSSDSDVKKFRLACLKAGVPEDYLNSDRWEVAPVRVIGSGNKTLQVLMADKLMAIRPNLDPQAQKEVDRIYVLANTDDPRLERALVPEVASVSSSVIEAYQSFGTLMQGVPMPMEDGVNHEEVIQVLEQAMGGVIQRCMQTGGMATEEQITGFNTVAQNIGMHLQKFAQIKTNKAKAKQFGDALGKMMNEVKAFSQRLAEQKKKEQANGQLDPADAAKIQAIALTAKTKADLASQSHAQKTAQRQISFEMQMKQDQQKHHAELAEKDLTAAVEIRRNGRLNAFKK